MCTMENQHNVPGNEEIMGPVEHLIQYGKNRNQSVKKLMLICIPQRTHCYAHRAESKSL